MGLPLKTISKLQLVQNAVARLLSEAGAEIMLHLFFNLHIGCLLVQFKVLVLLMSFMIQGPLVYKTICPTMNLVNFALPGIVRCQSSHPKIQIIAAAMLDCASMLLSVSRFLRYELSRASVLKISYMRVSLV